MQDLPYKMTFFQKQPSKNLLSIFRNTIIDPNHRIWYLIVVDVIYLFLLLLIVISMFL